jgi:hypothetical protein
MGVTATNLLMGPGTLYTGAFGAAEPADTAVNDAPPASAWSDLGGTDGGVTLNIEQEFADLKVDQLVDKVGRRLVSRELSFGTNLAEPTLENLKMAINGGTITTGAGYKALDPVNSSSATQANYFAAILDGFAPGATVQTRRVIGRKVLNVESVESSYSKDGQTYIPTKLATHYVSPSITPFHVVDGDAE